MKCKTTLLNGQVLFQQQVGTWYPIQIGRHGRRKLPQVELFLEIFGDMLIARHHPDDTYPHYPANDVGRRPHLRSMIHNANRPIRSK